MGSLASLVGPQPSNADSKLIELLRKIKQKTDAGKIRWGNWANGFVAPPIKTGQGKSLQVFFVADSARTNWSSFHVKMGDVEVAGIQNFASNPLLAVMSVSQPLKQAADDLFRSIVGENVIDAAISAVDNL
jgi:hypothetical protein